VAAESGGILNGLVCDCNVDSAYGYRSPLGTFRTVMACRCEKGQCDNYQGSGSCFPVPFFSGDASYQNGESLGGPENNNRAEIRKNKRAISRYR